MYCKYCGTMLEAGKAVCPACGARINLLDWGQSYFTDGELEAWAPRGRASGPTTVVPRTGYGEEEKNPEREARPSAAQSPAQPPRDAYPPPYFAQEARPRRREENRYDQDRDYQDRDYRDRDYRERRDDMPQAGYAPARKGRTVGPRDISPANKLIIGLIVAALVVAFAVVGVVHWRATHKDDVETTEPDVTEFGEAKEDAQSGETEAAETETASQTSSTLSLNDTRKELKVGETFTLEATLTPPDDTIKKSYISSQPMVASVKQDGTVTAVNQGMATITVSCNGENAYCTVICKEADAAEPTEPEAPASADQQDEAAGESAAETTTSAQEPEKITLRYRRVNAAGQEVGEWTAIKDQETGVTLTKEGQKIKLDPVFDPADSSTEITWSSKSWSKSEEGQEGTADVVSVSSDGVVTALSPGTASVTATTTAGTKVHVAIKCSWENSQAGEGVVSPAIKDNSQSGDQDTSWLPDDKVPLNDLPPTLVKNAQDAKGALDRLRDIAR